MSRDTALLDAARDRFEAAHREDARTIEVDGAVVPWALRYHQRLVHWVLHFSPDASVPLRLAASCQHIRRWAIPRTDYEGGRRGYRQWRRDLARFHAREAGGILKQVGYDDETIARVGDLLRKVGLNRDPEVQLFEDAICMVFFEMDFIDFAGKHEDAKLVGILRRTWAKLSEPGREAASEFARTLPPDVRRLVEEANRFRPLRPAGPAQHSG